MNLNFISDPNLVPRPAEEVKIDSFTLTPYDDGLRVRLEIHLTPFMPQVRPNLEFTVFNQESILVSSATIIETTSYINYLTLHLRDKAPASGEYLFKAVLYFEDIPEQDSVTKTIELTIPDQHNT